MELIDKLFKLETDSKEQIYEFEKCHREVTNVEQFKFQLSDRIENAKKLLNKCWEKRNGNLNNIFNSDIELHKYKKIIDNNVHTDKRLMQKDFIKEISKKYGNMMIKEEDFVNIFPENCYLQTIETEFKEFYIKKMLENEFNKVYSNFVNCLDQKIVNEINSYGLIHSKKTAINNTFNKFRDMKLYPTHQEYLKCDSSRKNTDWKLY